MRCRYREKVYLCGDYADVQFFPVFDSSLSKSVRKKRFKPTSEVQERLNAENAAKKLTRLIHTNFTNNDYALHLTYVDSLLPADEDEAKKDIKKFLRRLRSMYKKANIELKYIAVTEKGKRSARLHHHLIISGGVNRDDIENLWEKGYANADRLRFTKDGVAGLSNYIVKQPLFFKRWTSSRNLKKPVEQSRDGRVSIRKLDKLNRDSDNQAYIAELFKGTNLENYFVNDCICKENSNNGGLYITIRLYKKTAKIINMRA